jgi:hypothetical protein
MSKRCLSLSRLFAEKAPLLPLALPPLPARLVAFLSCFFYPPFPKRIPMLEPNRAYWDDERSSD